MRGLLLISLAALLAAPSPLRAQEPAGEPQAPAPVTGPAAPAPAITLAPPGSAAPEGPAAPAPVAPPPPGVAPAGATTADPRLDRAWTLSLGSGGGTFWEFAEAYTGTGIGEHEEQRGGRFQLDARIDRELGRWLRAGASYTLTGWMIHFKDADGANLGSLEEWAHTLLLDATGRWYRTEHLELYSRLGVGWAVLRRTGDVADRRYDDTFSGFAFQASLLGLSAGWRHVRGFAEIGVGFEGIVVGGVQVRL